MKTRTWHFQLNFTCNQKLLLFWETITREKNRKINRRGSHEIIGNVQFLVQEVEMSSLPHGLAVIFCVVGLCDRCHAIFVGRNCVAFVGTLCYEGPFCLFLRKARFQKISENLIHITVITVLFTVTCYMLLLQKSHCWSQSVAQVSVLGKARLRVTHATLIHHDVIFTYPVTDYFFHWSMSQLMQWSVVSFTEQLLETLIVRCTAPGVSYCAGFMLS